MKCPGTGMLHFYGTLLYCVVLAVLGLPGVQGLSLYKRADFSLWWLLL